MHEHSFIQSIIENVPDSDKVLSIQIELGELAGIEKDHLIEHLIDETGWKADVISKHAKIKCSCGFVGEPEILQRLHDMVIFQCPECGNDDVSVLEGKDIRILKVVYR